MSNFTTGHAAEVRAASYLKDKGYKVHELNWKTKYCEIDIIAEKDSVFYMIEVKYRKSEEWGQGLDYLTPKKLKRMRFAAEMWAQNHAWQGSYELAAISINQDKLDLINIT
jgi:Holliday junction resolvase-like predicted endonuclease